MNNSKDPETPTRATPQLTIVKMEKDNANPTILNTSQLPTRKGKKGRKVQRSAGPRITELMRKPQYLSDPFYDISWSGSDDTASDDEFTAEPIDEQEVYGKVTYLIHTSFPTVLFFQKLRANQRST